ncbi:MAG: hypothetical protein ACOC0N_04480 [Chroococcales cyanobacterium]
MPKLDDFNTLFDEAFFTDFDSLDSDDVQDLISKIKNSHHLRYQLMNLEIWALAQAMDQFIPGFWSRFLENRRHALKEFIKNKRKVETQETSGSKTDERLRKLQNSKLFNRKRDRP